MGDQAKPLVPFLQRADEMAKADPRVAYYCRMYAVEVGRRRGVVTHGRRLVSRAPFAKERQSLRSFFRVLSERFVAATYGVPRSLAGAPRHSRIPAVNYDSPPTDAGANETIEERTRGRLVSFPFIFPGECNNKTTPGTEGHACGVPREGGPYATEGMKIPDKSAELNELLGLLMEQLEGMKPTAGLGGAEEDELYVENFALKIFAKADK